MANYNLKLDLSKLEGFGKTTLTNKSGEKLSCIVIPIEANHVFLGEKGVYLNLTILESSNSQYGDTHFVTRSKSKDEQETEKQNGERIHLPILGNLKPFGTATANYDGIDEYSLPAPAQSKPAHSNASKPAPSPSHEAIQGDDDGLPF